MHIKPRTGHVALPGYDRAARRFNKCNWDGEAAWTDLGLFPVDAADDFLDGVLDHLTKHIKTDTENGKKDRAEAREEIRTVVLSFALIAVEADRDQRELDDWQFPSRNEENPTETEPTPPKERGPVPL